MLLAMHLSLVCLILQVKVVPLLHCKSQLVHRHWTAFILLMGMWTVYLTISEILAGFWDHIPEEITSSETETKAVKVSSRVSHWLLV
jgi:hypothetical protein